jgi:hypothetical protein
LAHQKTPTLQAKRENSHPPSQTAINSDGSIVSSVALNTLQIILITSAQKIDLRHAVALCVPLFKESTRGHILTKPGTKNAITLISPPLSHFFKMYNNKKWQTRELMVAAK